MNGHRPTCLILTFSLLIGCAVAAHGDPVINADAIAKVQSGQLTEAHAAWWGFDKRDATRALQAALRSGAKRVVVEAMGAPWIVTPIDIPSNVEIVFRKGAVVEAKRGAFRGGGDCLFRIRRRHDVSLIGYGAVLRMHRADYARPPYAKAEWRHVLSITSSSNVKVYGLTLAESGGDGIYLGTAQRGVTNKQIHIKDVICDRNYRQGISVITAEDLLIEKTVLKNTGGTPPAAGIDFEPNHASERIVRCVMRDCVVENNQGDGYVFYLPALNGTSAPISVRFERCVARGSNRVPFRFFLARPNRDGPARGRAEFIHCTFAGGSGPGIAVSNKPVSGCKVRFADCRIANLNQKTPRVPAILIDARGDLDEDIGGVAFDDCIVDDTTERPLLKFHDTTRELRLVDVTGTLIVRCRGRETNRPITPQWLGQYVVGKRFRRFPPYVWQGVRFEPAAGSLNKQDLVLRPLSLRGQGAYGIYARGGDEISFRLRHLQVGNYEGKPLDLWAITPSGKRLPLESVPLKQERAISFPASETGLYRVAFRCGPNMVQMTAANRPVAVVGEQGEIHFLSVTGDFYFYVPAGTKAFGIKIQGQGREAVGGAVFDPDDHLVWQRPTIAAAEQFVATPAAPLTGRVWRIRLTKPSAGPMEDFTVQLQGIPPLLSRDPKALCKPVGK